MDLLPAFYTRLEICTRYNAVSIVGEGGRAPGGTATEATFAYHGCAVPGHVDIVLRSYYDEHIASVIINVHRMNKEHRTGGAGWRIGGQILTFISFILAATVIGSVFVSPAVIDPPEASFALFWLKSLLSSAQLALAAVSLIWFIIIVAVIRAHREWGVIPLVINGVAVLFLVFSPFLIEQQADARFIRNLPDYQAVVQLVGEMDINESEVVDLPAQYRHLSLGGQILVRNHAGVTAIVFYERTSFYYAEGYLYLSEDRPPVAGDLGGGISLSATEVAPHWYSVSIGS